MSPQEPVKVTRRVVGEAPAPAAQPPAEAPQIMMMRDEKDQVMDWLFESCKNKNKVINELNTRLIAAQRQLQQVVDDNVKQQAEIERLTAIVHPPQPQAPASDAGAGAPAIPAAPEPAPTAA